MNTDEGGSRLPPIGWWQVENIDEIDSPALLIFPDRVEENIRRMIGLAGTPDRLRPHIKTHKLPEIIRMHLAAGISRFKCATIAEAELLAECGAMDILLAYQPVGPKVQRLVALAKAFPNVRFAVLFDDPAAATNLSDAAKSNGIEIGLYLDLDCGMGRTGIFPGPEAIDAYARASRLPAIRLEGLHAYDGHIADRELLQRIKRCDEAFGPVFALREEMVGKGLDVPSIVAGGTPTFPIHAQRRGVECAPGTCVLWDAGYASKLPDLDFLVAAVVITRVVSKPRLGGSLALPGGGSKGRVCLDLGHKSIAAENPHPRVQFLDLPDATPVVHSEEHLVVETPHADTIPLGACIYGIPWHICPTVALHSEVVVIREGRAVERWKIVARDRQLRF